MEGQGSAVDKTSAILPTVSVPHSGAEGHAKFANANELVPTMPDPDAETQGHMMRAETQAIVHLPTVSAASSGVKGQVVSADKATHCVPTMPDPIFDIIRALHRERQFHLKQKNRVLTACQAYLRTRLGWRLDLPDKERKAIERQASKLMDEPTDAFRQVVEASRQAAEPFEDIQKTLAKKIERAAEHLPVWQFAKDIRGFGALSLGTIVGEAGDLANYPTKSKLWKRMCVGLIDGRRQGNPGTGADADEWIRHGYKPARRALLWQIGANLIMLNDGEYRAVYSSRKNYELARGCKKLHAHNRAKRYMEKRLLRDLWQAWNKDQEGSENEPVFK
jgi:hypothetical protein